LPAIADAGRQSVGTSGARDPTNQIPMDSEGIRKVYELSSTAVYTPAFTVENTGLSDADIVSRFKGVLVT
jgi:hypothetical protein